MGLFDWLKNKKPAEASTGKGWKIGDRVLAKWDAFFYPGKVREISGDKCLIAFDDGDSAMIQRDLVLPPDIQVGSRVFCRVKKGPQYLPGKVDQQKGETILVRYDHGDEEWTSISMVRVQRPEDNSATPVKQALDLGAPVKDTNWRQGDRVLARWLDFFWYPGTILDHGEKGVHILYDDGDQRVVQEVALRPLLIEEGEHLFIRPKNEPQRIYTPATVTRVNNESLDVELEDGTLETNTRVSRARFWHCPVRVANMPFEEGDRVLAFDGDDCLYPAEIVSIQDEERIIVQYLDGPERMLTPELVKRFELRPGARVECRWRGGPNYFPGKLAKVEGERVFVKYDDGDEEWTSVRLFRMPPKRA